MQSMDDDFPGKMEASGPEVDLGRLSNNTPGVCFALFGSALFATSNIIIKRGLRLAGAKGVSAGDGGYTYLVEPTWWMGMVTMIAGEMSNFLAYAYSPPTLVTPLGSFSSIVLTVVLAHIFANDRLNMFGVLGCILSLSGSAIMVLTVPEERRFESILEVWGLAQNPGFIFYSGAVCSMLAALMCHSAPRHGSSSVFVYPTISALIGSLSIMAAKALAISLRLTMEGSNQFVYVRTWFFPVVILVSLVVQQNYTNKALDIFKSGLVIPVNYIVFNVSTIVGYLIMFQVTQTATEILTEICGFITVVSGVFLIYSTKALDMASASFLWGRGSLPKTREPSLSSPPSAQLSSAAEEKQTRSNLRQTQAYTTAREEAADHHYPTRHKWSPFASSSGPSPR